MQNISNLWETAICNEYALNLTKINPYQNPDEMLRKIPDDLIDSDVPSGESNQWSLGSVK